MIKPVSFFAIVFTAMSSLQAQQKKDDPGKSPSHFQQPDDAVSVFTIYPGIGIPSDSKSWNWTEKTIKNTDGIMTRNVVIPTLTMFRPAQGKSNGTSIVIAPGGAFYFLAIDKEGYEVARWLAGKGITAFVLKYRLAQTPGDDTALPDFLSGLFQKLPRQGSNDINPPIGTEQGEKARLLAEDDGRQAIRFLRSKATDLKIDPQKIGIMGFSAGGGVAVNVALEHDSESRPDFVAGVYAGWRVGPKVPNDAPPLFLAIGNNDVLVGPKSSSLLSNMWNRSSRPVELHIFENGEHGFGARKNDKLSDSWTFLFEQWLSAHGF